MDEKQWELQCFYTQLYQNDRKMCDYTAGLVSEEQHAIDVEERQTIYEEIAKREKT